MECTLGMIASNDTVHYVTATCELNTTVFEIGIRPSNWSSSPVENKTLNGRFPWFVSRISTLIWSNEHARSATRKINKLVSYSKTETKLTSPGLHREVSCELSKHLYGVEQSSGAQWVLRNIIRNELL